MRDGACYVRPPPHSRCLANGTYLCSFLNFPSCSFYPPLPEPQAKLVETRTDLFIFEIPKGQEGI